MQVFGLVLFLGDLSLQSVYFLSVLLLLIAKFVVDVFHLILRSLKLQRCLVQLILELSSFPLHLLNLLEPYNKLFRPRLNLGYMILQFSDLF